MPSIWTILYDTPLGDTIGEMMKRTLKPLNMALAAAIGACCAACDPGMPDFPAISMESEHVKVGIATDDVICAEWLVSMDRYVAFAMAALGIEEPVDKVPVYIYRQDDLESICHDENAGGCFLWTGNGEYGVVIGNESLNTVTHEINHYLMIEVLGIHPHSFYDEGIAEALSDDSCALHLSERPSLDEVSRNVQETENRLQVNGFFKKLISEFGMDQVKKWGEKSGEKISFKKLETAFEDIFETSLVSAWEGEWTESVARKPDVGGCLAETVSWADGQWTHRFTGTCDADTVWYEWVHVFRQQVALEVEQAGEYFVFGDGLIEACDVCLDNGSSSEIGRGRVSIEAGRYVVSAQQTLQSAPLESQLWIRPWEACNPFEDPCPANEKCSDVGSGDFTCVPVIADAGTLGQICLSVSIFNLTDPCGKGLICAHARCRTACTGSLAEPTCPEGSSCFTEDPILVSDWRAFSLPGACIETCNPLAADCADNEHCLSSPLSDGFVCSQLQTDELGDYGDPWCKLDGCKEGLYCALNEAVVPDCETDDLGCCTAVCTPGDNAQCPDADAGQVCTPHPTVSAVGYCTLAQ